MRSAVVEEEGFFAAVELIHAAALNPAGWDAVLRRLASLTGCVAGGLTVERPKTRQGTPLTYFGFDASHVERTFDHYLPMNPLFEIERRMQPGFVVTNGDVVPLAEFRRSEFYNGWARPQGLCSPATVVIYRTAAAYVPLTLVRADGTGEVTEDGQALLSRLAPHLVHAMNVTVGLQAADRAARSLQATLDVLPCGALLLDRDGRVLFANQAAEALLARGGDGPITYAGGRIAARHPDANRQVQAALSAALGDGVPAKAGQVTVGHGPGARQVTISVSPLPASDTILGALNEDVPGEPRCLVLVRGSEAAAVAVRYGLTPAETRVLSALIDGKGLTAAARELGVARSTAHSHLDKIFQKTDTNRQAELVGLARSGFGP